MSPRRAWILCFMLPVVVAGLSGISFCSHTAFADQVQASPAPIRGVEPPPTTPRRRRSRSGETPCALKSCTWTLWTTIGQR